MDISVQVLVSIQALVLNEKPYFNEPGLGGIPGRRLWEKKSAAYSEDVFVLSCKTMLWLLRQPPMGFEAFTAAHFRDRARPILAACQVYALGVAKVGCYSLTARRAGQSSATSERFKGSMKELYPALVSAFRGVGASVADFGDQLPSKAAVPPNSTGAGEERTANKKKIRGFADKIFAKLGKLLGLQKRMTKKKKGEVYSSTQVIPKPPELLTALV